MLLLAGAVTSWAVDVSPSRRVVPEKFIDPPGKRYSLFAGDPERVQRANEVNLEDFSASLEIEPKSLSLGGAGPDAAIKLSFKVRNTGEKSYTLSFPDSQRFDYAIVTENDSLVYLWSDDKAFMQQTGMSFVNGGEMIQFSDSIPVSTLKDLVVPGSYKIVMILSNYPEIKAAQALTVSP